MFPHAQRLSWDGKDIIALPHGIDETKMLRNIGIAVPAPIVEHYDFPSADGMRPFDKQILTASSMTMNSRSYVLNKMGTGKTKSAIWSHDYLQRTGKAGSMLVVAPLSTLRFTWEREIFKTLPHKKVVVLTGDAKRRRKLLAEPADIYIINHDGLKVIAPQLQQRPDITVFCFDEASAYRNARAERSKVARKLGATRKFVWAMTGSPTPGGPTDAFGLAHLVNPNTAPRSFVQFRQDTMLQVNQFKWVPKKNAADIVSNLLQPGVCFTLEDIIELPPVIERTVEVPIGNRQKLIYDRLREHASALLKEGTVTAANGGVLFSKLQQVSVGWVYGEGEKRREVFSMYRDDEVNPRIEALLDLIESAERKVIVFSPFKSAAAGISHELRRHKIDFAEVTGDTPMGERTDIFSAFQGTDKYRVLNAHPECMSHGLTLTAADTIVWFGPTTKLEVFEQANARITRIGQTTKQQIIKLVGTPIEKMVYQRLASKQGLQDSIIDILAEITSGDS